MDLSEIVKKYDLRVFCFALTKMYYLKYLIRCQAEKRRRERYPVNVDLDKYLKDPESYARFNLLSLVMEESVAHIAFDGIMNGYIPRFFHDRKHKKWMNEALEVGVSKGRKLVSEISMEIYGDDLSPYIEFSIVDSENEPCIWISDWISNEVSNYIRGSDMSLALRSLKDNTLFVGFDENGVKRGTSDLSSRSHLEYPDQSKDPIGEGHSGD